MNQGIKISCLIALIFISVFFQSCTLIGFGIGAAADALRSASYDSLSVSGVEQLLSGTNLIVTTADGNVRQGEFVQMYWIPPWQYRMRESVPLLHVIAHYPTPLTGDSVTVVVDPHDRQRSGKLIGFDQKYIWLHAPGHEEPVDIPLSVVREIRTGSGVLPSETMYKYIEAGKCPLLLGIIIENRDGVMQIPMDEVDRIIRPDNQNGRFIGFISGLVLDVTALIIVYQALQEF